MRLRRLATERFRNLESVELATDRQFIVLHGPNAQGKTNTLEAVYLLANLRPLRARRNAELVRWGEERTEVSGTVQTAGLEHSCGVSIGPSGRTVSLDGKRTSDLLEYFGCIRAIAFAPTDADIVLGEPVLRRSWVDRAAFTRSPLHLEIVRSFRRTLKQKGAALRSERPDRAVVEALNARLAHDGARLVMGRRRILAELEPHVRSLHRAIAGHDLPVTLTHRTSAPGKDQAEVEGALTEKLRGALDDELRRRRALVGPQRDDVVIAIDGVAARTYGSRGQIRSLVLSLKLAELVAARARGTVPLFLLDDVSSELDAERTERLVGTLIDLGAQVFATTTDTSTLSVLPSDETLWVAVSEGRMTVGGCT